MGASSSASGTEAFRWTSGGGMVGLGDLPGSIVLSYAMDVSANGSVVVGWGSTTSGEEAFVWDAISGMREIDQVLTGLGIDLTGWTPTRALGTSADGLTIVGWGYRWSDDPENATPEGWIAVIPEPGTASLFAVGLLGLAVTARRARAASANTRATE